MRALPLPLLLLLAAPPAAAYDPAAGRRLYAAHCADCHGVEGKGDGPAAVRLDPRPRDLTSGIYKIRTTPSGSLPTPDDIVATLRRGLPGTAMPSFAGVLTPREMEDLAGFLLRLPKEADWKTEPPVAIGKPIPPSPRSVARGRKVYERVRCFECHGDAGRGDGRSAGLLAGEFGRPTRPADLSAPWTFKGGAEPADIVTRLAAGLDGTPMPSTQDQTTPQDRWDLANYIVSLRRTPPWALDAPGLAAWDAARFPDRIRRGQYLARAMTCGLCHTTTRASDGAYHEARELAGGVKIVAYPFGAFVSSNLTSDEKSGLGSWSEAQIVQALRSGTRPDGRRIAFMGMPWAFFSRLPDADLQALAAYLKTLPPAENHIPARRDFLYIEVIGAKLANLFFRQPATTEVWPGNAGFSPQWGNSDYAPYGPQDVPGQRRRYAWYAFFGVLLPLLILAGWLLLSALSLRRRRQQAVALAAGTSVVLVGLGGFAALYFMPPLDLLAPETVAAMVADGLPQPKPQDPRLLPLARRGRSLVTANCAMCHTPVPMIAPPDPRLHLAGGVKAVSPRFGTRHSRNLTPDPETGLGDWSFAEILRAVRSGVAKDGRRIHWNDMPWDRFSNFSEEDLVAMAAYLKSIPPIRRRLPPPGPAPEGVPAAVSVYFGDSGKLVE